MSEDEEQCPECGCNSPHCQNDLISEFLNFLHKWEKKRLDDSISKQDICVALLNEITKWEEKPQ